jgi:putative hemolysin
MMGNKRRFQLMLLAGKIVSITAGTVLLVILFGQVMGTAGFSSWESMLAGFAVSTLVFFITEGIISRIISVGEHETAVSRFAPFLSLFHVVFFPLTSFFDSVLSVFIKRNTEMAAKEEALIELVKSESESGVIEEEEGEMIQSVLSFYDTTAREVMVPRIDVVAADITMPIDELITLFRLEGHSRIPIFEGRIDNIVGVMYSKDLLIAIAERDRNRVSIAETMRKPFFVPETKKISELLNELRSAKVHLAIVVDEYGGTSGIVALEDIIEEIVGDIQDEYDQDEGDFSWIDDHTVLMDAGLNIDDVNDILRTDIPNENFDTLGGFIYHQLGFIPEGGEKVMWEDISFTIREIIGNRISKVLVTLPETRTENEHTEA